MNPALTIAPLLTLFALATAASPAPRALARAATLGWLAFAAILGAIAAAVAGWGAGDPLALIALLLTGLVGAVVLSFSHRYLRADADPRRFAVTTLLLLASVALFVTGDSFWLIALGWIASGWLMAALVGHVAGWRAARVAQRRMLASFALGDAALIAALLLLASGSGGSTLGTLAVPTGIAGTAAALLLVVAACVRCALPPLHRWLGRSMTAPTPASALMHAGFVNAGGLLLIRFAPVLEAAPAARALAIGAGLAAALIGTAMMLVRADVKRALAGSTSAQMGFMLMTCGLGAYAAALWHIVAHGLFKAWLFLRSGSAIGIGARPVAMRIAPAGVATIGVIAVAAALALGSAGRVTPGTVPLILAAAMALAALVHLRRDAALTLGAALLAALYALGVLLIDQLLPHPAGPAMGGALLATALVAIFMLAWLVQTLALDRRIALPPALYARLLTA